MDSTRSISHAPSSAWWIITQQLLPRWRHAALVVVLAVIAGTPASAQVADKIEQMEQMEQMEQSTVRIITLVELADGSVSNLGSGSGFVLPNDHVVTNSHVATSEEALIAQLVPRFQKEKPGFRRDPLIVVMKLLSLLLALITAVLLAIMMTRQGREIVKEAVTRSRDFATRTIRPDALKRPLPAPPLSPRQQKATLYGLTGPFANETFDLDDDGVTLGRDPRVAQLVFPPQATPVSKRHATIRFDARQGMFLLEDCESTNGTFLQGGERLEAGETRRLKPGMQFYLGDPQYLFEVRRG